MIFVPFLWLYRHLLDAITAVFRLANNSTPDWINTALQSTFNSFGLMNNFLPMYAHPEMTGLVHSIGILTILGFLMITFVGLAIIAVGFGLFYLLIQIAPWNTQK